MRVSEWRQPARLAGLGTQGSVGKRKAAGLALALAGFLAALFPDACRAARPDIVWMAGGHAGAVGSVAFSPDGQTLASGSYDNTIKLWRVSDGTLLRTLTGHRDSVLSVAFSPDGQTLASGSWDRTITLWRVSDGRLLRTLTGHTYCVTSVAFSPDGETLASGSGDRTIRLWRVSDGTLLRTLTGHTSPVTSVAFSPDGQTLASGSDSTIKLWRVSDGTLLRTLTGHNDYVNSVAFSPDGQTLVSGSGHGTVRLWQVSNGALRETFDEETGPGVHSVAFSPDGSLLAWGRGDGTVVVALNPYVPDPEAPVAEITEGPVTGSVVGAAVTFGYAGTDNVTPASALQFSYRFDGGAWSAFTSATSVTRSLAHGPHTFSVRARDAAGNIGQPVTRAFFVDAIPSSIPAVLDAGAFTSDNARLSASWSSSDPESGVAEYEYAIGTSPADPGSGYVVAWKSAGTATQAAETGLSLQEGVTYYWYVRARNGAGLWSQAGASDGITVDLTPPQTSITGGPSQGSYTSAASASFSWSGTDNLAASGDLRFQ